MAMVGHRATDQSKAAIGLWQALGAIEDDGSCPEAIGVLGNSGGLMRRVIPVLFLLLTATSAAAQPHGIELGDLNRSVEPCVDFYEFANGTWRANNPIPASMPRWSRRWAAGEQAKEQLRAILDEISHQPPKPRGSVEQLIGDHYAACMDQATIDRQGVQPLKPLLDSIAAIKSSSDLQGVLRSLHDIGIDVPFGIGGQPDLHDPTRVIADVYASGLGLPDRDYYFKEEPRFKETREKYRAHVAKIFELAGLAAADAADAAARVMAVETTLAEASLDNVARRDPQALDHKTTFVQLQALAPGLDWTGYFTSAGLPQGDLNVDQPKFLEAVNRELTATPIRDWQRYLEWHLLHSAAESLSRPFVNETFAFYGQHLSGAKEMKPRWKQCVESTDALLGEALGQKYVERHFPPAAKARMQSLVHNLLLSMHDVIDEIDWMGPETKQRALEKLSTFNPKIGYPDKWKDYSKVAIGRTSFWDDVVAGRRFNVDDDRSTIGKPVDRGRWGMTPPTSDAYYNPFQNEIVFPAGILQPPAFSMDAVDAVNYGAIGVVIGHEISHGFDDEGSQFDAEGRLHNWWTAEDRKRFEDRAACVVDQFEHYEIEPGIHHNGKLVLGEAIGDLAGAKIAYLAFQKAQRDNPAPTLNGFTPDQQFFIAWGQFRGDAIRPELQRLMVQGDPHPIAKFRVIGPVSNLPSFAHAFSCRADQPMVRPPAKRCEVW
jgi:putative endopeptidase